MSKRKQRKLNDVELAILSDFNRKPVRSKGEIADRDGRALIRSVDHYYQRPLGVLMSRKHIDFFKRCGCEHPCDCNCNGWHITESGVAELAAAARASLPLPPTPPRRPSPSTP